ncbi:MAG: NADH-quinone oxidoreductase subunit C [Candidatus Omnitrophota bacterium]
MDIREKIKEGLGKKILEWKEQAPRRVYFTVDKKDIVNTAELLFKKLGLRFSTASGMEIPSGFEILYHFTFDKTGEYFTVRIFIKDKKNPEVDSLAPLFPGAEWIEREMWEMLGIRFLGHPNLKRLLLADDWPENEYPLRQKHES